MPAAARDLLLERLVDYAGLFPPAALALAPALDAYAAYRTGADAWMLGRFVVPVGALPEVPAARLHGAPWRFSVLGHATDTPGAEAWLGAARRTLDDAGGLRGARVMGRRCRDRFEIRLAPALVSDPDALVAVLAELASDLDADHAVALEVPVEASAVEAAGAAVAEANRKVGEANRKVGEANRKVGEANARLGGASAPFALKLRCGGVTPDAIPAPEALAACARGGPARRRGRQGDGRAAPPAARDGRRGRWAHARLPQRFRRRGARRLPRVGRRRSRRGP